MRITYILDIDIDEADAADVWLNSAAGEHGQCTVTLANLTVAGRQIGDMIIKSVMVDKQTEEAK